MASGAVVGDHVLQVEPGMGNEPGVGIVVSFPRPDSVVPFLDVGIGGGRVVINGGRIIQALEGAGSHRDTPDAFGNSRYSNFFRGMRVPLDSGWHTLSS